jgi:CHAD domain-containing protein
VSKTLSQFKQELPEKDEHKTSREYKKLSPKMQKAVDAIFKEMDSKPSDFLNTFEKTINDASKKFKVPHKQLMDYFEKEVLTAI